MSKDIKLGKSKVTISLKVGDLPKIGLMVGDMKNNLNVLGNILAGLNSGDIMVLLDVLHMLSDDGVTDDAVNEMVEDAPAKDVETAYDTLLDFFEKSPLTSKQAKIIDKTIKEKMQEAMESGVEVKK